MIDTLEIDGTAIPVFKSDNTDSNFDDETITFLIESLASPEIQSKIKEVVYGGDKHISLGDGISLEFINAGSFSIVYKMNIDGKSFIVKLLNSEMQQTVNYMSEMNRMNKLDQELGEFLNSQNVYIPSYEFSTVNMCCRQMIDGRQLSRNEAQPIVENIEEEMNSFLERMKVTNKALWGNIQIDLRDKIGLISGNNFILAEDGKIYFIDPFNN
ncbi:MAG: hypothetical protein ACMG57_00085 [Candidatus Dojkabacteria bacterium]